MNNELIKKAITTELDKLSKEQVAELMYFFIVVYSIFTSLLQNLGNMVNFHAESFDKAVKQSDTVVGFIDTVFKAGKEEISKE
jgi:hypothetical protein